MEMFGHELQIYVFVIENENLFDDLLLPFFKQLKMEGVPVKGLLTSSSSTIFHFSYTLCQLLLILSVLLRGKLYLNLFC